MIRCDCVAKEDGVELFAQVYPCPSEQEYHLLMLATYDLRLRSLRRLYPCAHVLRDIKDTELQRATWVQYHRV